MRNIFDQYSQPENRVTHALATALAEDSRLLRDFVVRFTGRKIPAKRKLCVIEQQLPGDPEVSEEEAEKRGLPDACVYDENWALLIESKVASRVNIGQLQRHLRTATQRGIREATVLVISTIPARRPAKEMHFIQWSDVYSWLFKNCARSEWARRAKAYLETTERRFIESEYLKEGTLTKFSGIPFNNKYPYNYFEAKRLLRLAMDELRRRKDLQNMLGVDPRCKGRGAIKGRDADSVWDFLSLKAGRNVPFTKHPHLTLALQRNRIVVILVVPNGAQTRLRRGLLHYDESQFTGLLQDLARSISRAIRGSSGASPHIEIVQRHYPNQSSSPIIDARLEYDPRTLVNSKKLGGAAKYQPEWVRATYDVLQNRRSNIQFAIGAVFPYAGCRSVSTEKILDDIAGIWIACRGLLDVVSPT